MLAAAVTANDACSPQIIPRVQGCCGAISHNRQRAKKLVHGCCSAITASCASWHRLACVSGSFIPLLLLKSIQCCYRLSVDSQTLCIGLSQSELKHNDECLLYASEAPPA